jgi:NhaA family Na+:H+ antiporter
VPGARNLDSGAPGSLVGNVVPDPERPPVPANSPIRPRLLTRGSWPETRRITAILRKETVGGALLLAATVAALVWANSPWADSYVALRDLKIGPAALHLNLSLGTWAADGLLAIFFFVVGLELKREFVAGDLHDPTRAALPILAAVGGMVAPALVYVAINAGSGSGAVGGWAIPTATDIAFALAVLAVVSTHLPTALRTFLLTLAVVDDLLAVIIIAVFYTPEVHLGPLLGSLAVLGLFAAAVQRRIRSWWLLLPLAIACWALMHASGVHATVAGVLLGFAVPVLRSRAAGGPDAGPGLAEHFEHRLRPLSAGVAVPIFAFFAAGVTVGGISGFIDSLHDPVALGIAAGLVIGKVLGIFGTTALVARFTKADLDANLRWADVLGVSLLGGIGFTVSLLIGGLAFGTDAGREAHLKVGVLTGSVVAAVLATVVLRSRNRAYRQIEREESADADDDGVPDVFAVDRGSAGQTREGGEDPPSADVP